MQKLCILLATVLLGLTSAASGSELNLSNCFSKSDGTIFPIEDNCNAFIYCLRQQAIVVPCGLDMGFSKTAQGCVAVDQSDCIVNTWLDFEESPRHKSGESKGSKENSKGNSKENSKGNSKENSKEKSKENSKGNSKENSKEKSKENSKEKTSNEIECGGPIGFDADGCVGYDNGVLWRYKYNCNAYINCTDECPVMFYCPKDKVFNELLQICDTPDTAECVEETAPETTTPKTTTIKTTTAKPKPTLPPGNDPESCRGETNGTLLPHPSDCKQFYKCIEEEVTIETCPGELIYNSDLEICDYPYDFECGSATKPPKTTTAKPQTTPSNGICKGKPKGTKLPVEDDCTKYWMCLPTEEAVLIPCPAKNWFNPETGECGPNVSPDACRATGTTPAPSGTTTPSSSGNPCEGKPDYTNVPYPEDCKKYNMCVGGKPTVVSCPGNNWFNPDTGRCGPQVSPTACKNPTGTTPSGTTPEGTTSLPITTSAPGNNHGICGSLTNGEKVPYPGSCRKFVICGQPAPIADYCEYLLWFNEELQKCVFPEESDCKQPGWTLPPTTTTPTPEPTTEASTEPTKPTKPPPPKGPCDGMDYGTLLPYPNNCSKYIVCRTPINVGYDCPEGLEFSVAERTCMLPEWANCNSGGNGGSSRELFMGASIDDCAFQMDGTTLPYFDNCGQYIICQNNRQLIHSCYPNTFYNPEKGSCDKATLSTACRQSIIPKIAKPSCRNLKSGSVLSVKNDWSRYYLCSEGESIQLQCKENWHFDAIQAKCVQ